MLRGMLRMGVTGPDPAPQLRHPHWESSSRRLGACAFLGVRQLCRSRSWRRAFCSGPGKELVRETPDNWEFSTVAWRSVPNRERWEVTVAAGALAEVWCWFRLVVQAALECFPAPSHHHGAGERTWRCAPSIASLGGVAAPPASWDAGRGALPKMLPACSRWPVSLRRVVTSRFPDTLGLS